jgi:hypothetical protein
MVDNRTGEQVSAFTEAVDKGFAGLQRGTASVVSKESHFSWSPCELCGSTLGGDREDVDVLTFSNTTVTLAVCVDCVMYVANGDEPDEWEGE